MYYMFREWKFELTTKRIAHSITMRSLKDPKKRDRYFVRKIMDYFPIRFQIVILITQTLITVVFS